MDATAELLGTLADPHEKPDRHRRRVLDACLRRVSRELDLTGSWHVDLRADTAVLTYEEPSYLLRLRIGEPVEKAWFYEPTAKVAVYADGPAGRDRDAGQRSLRRIGQFLKENGALFARVSHHLQTDRYAEEDLTWFQSDRVPEAINKASFHFLNIFKYGSRLEKVRRPGLAQWYSASSGEFYPWPGAVGSEVDEPAIRRAWKAYADDYEQHRLPLSIYLHIPFCARVCNFCHCSKAELKHGEQVTRYVDALIAELREYAPILGRVPVTTLYLGGGTPSVVSAADLRRLLETVESSYVFTDDFQFSCEANPDSLTEEKIDVLCEVIPLDRLSLGVQTIDPAAQECANRFNKPDKIQRLVAYARQKGVQNVHFDLIAGLDGLLYDNFRRDLRTVARFGPETVKVYGYRPFRFKGETLEVIVDEDLVERRMAQTRWAEKFLRRTHSLGLGISAEAIRAQRNLQIDYSYEHTSALLSLGVSGVNYVPFQMYYEVPMDIEKYIDARQDLRHRAVPTSLRGDLHGKLVKSLQMAIDVAELTRKFGADNVRDALAPWSMLKTLGVRLDRGRLSFKSYSTTKLHLAKYFLSAPEIRERLAERFDGQYEPARNYFIELARLLDGEILVGLGRLDA